MSYAEWIDPDWSERLAAGGLADLRALLGDAPPASGAARWSELSKPGLRGRRRWRCELADGSALFVKRYAQTPLRSQIDRVRRQSLRHGSAWWEQHAARELAAAQVPAVQAVAWCEEMRGAIELRGAVVLAAAAGMPMDRLIREQQATGAPALRGPARHDLTRRLARFINAFHQTGFTHRDLYLCHIFAELDPQAQRAPTFCLIDLARLHRPRLRRMRWLLKDLAQLDSSALAVGATRTDRLRFLRTYLCLLPRAPRTRWYAAQITRRSARIMQREARRTAQRR
ncbi:MAG: hypothetical protein IPM64_16015 [Phycisphaerales bacterium]|nr:hypothetical protein [Phycisphaerales bacterium]